MKTRTSPDREMARLSRLCDLITSSLETSACVPSRESEKRLLLSLSSVYKEIQKLCKLQELGDETPAITHNCVAQTEKASYGKYKCLSNIVFTMVSFFEHDSEFVQHLTASILFTISTSLIAADRIWVRFLLFLWITLANTISSICGPASPCSQFENTPLFNEIIKHKMLELDISSSDIESFVSVLQSRKATLTSKTVLGIFQVFHRMSKYLKNKANEEFELGEKFILLSVKFLQNLPWDLYGKIDFGSSKLKAVLSCCILQFVCSLVQKNDFEDSENSLMEVSDLHSKIGDLVPKFLSCLFDSSDGGDKCLIRYMRHKTLMLMIRLSFHGHDISRVILWLRFLKQYFPDLIYKPFSNYIITPECCLEESPFFFSCSNNELVSRNPQTRHMQRQTLLLLLRYCFELIQASNGIKKEQCLCGKETPLIDCGTQLCCCCCVHIGLSEISDWLKRGFVCQVNTLKSPIDFGLSFLQLFMDEQISSIDLFNKEVQDDMLFSMLLQLLDASPVALQIESKRACYNDLHLLSSIINPVCLFHLLLFSLKYDHMVLIDYLKSKDTGVYCARFLLRCLRFVTQSWQSFVEFSISQLELTETSNKRQKLSHEFGASASSKTFGDAKECLVSLKNTLEDLHKKNLFPYNPTALIRRYVHST